MIGLKQLQQIFQTGIGNKVGEPLAVVATGSGHPGVQTPQSTLLNKPVDEVLHVTKVPRKCVVVLSPFMSEDKALASKYERYAKACVRDSLKHNESPNAMYAYFYSVLDMNNPVERDRGLAAALDWCRKADLLAVYIDYGTTPAMELVIAVAKRLNLKLEYRTIGEIA